MSTYSPTFFDVQLSVRDLSGGERREQLTVVIEATTERDAAQKVREKYQHAEPRLESIRREG